MQCQSDFTGIHLLHSTNLIYFQFVINSSSCASSVAVDNALKTCCLTLSCGSLNLKVEQEEAIKDVLLGMDVSVSLPTGVEKSSCYALVPTVHDIVRIHSSTVVI